MCGIAGFVNHAGLDADAPRRATAMRDVLVHRGPDAAGLHCDGFAALGHRRLSIVDLSTGSQPLCNEDGRIWVIFNGEIYNHAELRQELAARGHQYQTRSDTESIVHAYEEWGDDCVQRFRGMFAFAIWDARQQRLLLSRDRLGVKPVYWARCGGTLLFASEVKGLLASGLIEPALDVDSLPELLGTRAVSGESTLFAGIRKLLPGHQLVFERGTLRTRQYWDVPTDTDESVPDAEVVPRFRALLEESVRLRLMSDVPLGMFLSGGLDSSAIAAVMARQIDRPLETFSVAFREHAFNELPYARQVVKAIGARGHEVVVGDDEFFEALPRLIWHEDEPIGHPSSVPLNFVSNLARRHVTVVLTGEGSDELLAGYGKYLRAVWNWRAGGVYERLVPDVIRQALARGVPSLPSPIRKYASRSFLAVGRTPESMFFDNFAAVRLSDQQALLHASRRGGATAGAAYGSSRAAFDRPATGPSLLTRLLYADLKTYVVELLMRQDQMSMASSIESRVPFLDHRLVEFAARLPDRWKLSGLTTKRVLREAMKGLLPDSILNRPKMGFPVPFGPWARRRWNGVVGEILLDRRTRERGLFDAAAVSRLVADHAAGRTDGSDRLWTLLNLELWHRTFIDRGGTQALPAPTPIVRSHAHPVAEVGSPAAAR